MGKGEQAALLHPQGFNCAQCVLKVCSDYTGLDDATATAVASGFGGGVRSGEICGAATGGVMAIGLTASRTGNTDKIASLTKNFVAQFRADQGCVRCAELKGKGLTCDELIAYAADLADDVLSKLC